MVEYENDAFARYLADRILSKSIAYDRAILSNKTTKEAIDWWIEKYNEK